VVVGAVGGGQQVVGSRRRLTKKIGRRGRLF